jgi:hypothetical protein
MTAKHVYQAINEVTAIMAREGIAKSRNNAQQGYKFRGIDDVYAALSGHLAAAKLCILPRVVERTSMERPTKSGGVSNYTILTVEFDLVSAVDDSTHTIRTVGEAMDTADKSTNKAMSAAMKYACLIAFQIPTEGDNDADAHSPEPVARRAAPIVNTAPVNVDAAVESYVTAIDKAPNTKALMALYTKLQADPALPAATKTYVVSLCTAKRKQLETAAA